MDKVNLFVSYSHGDKEDLPELFAFLNPSSCPLINFWTDEKIDLGQEWNIEISDAINKADIVLLIISQHFLNSHFIQNNELTTALQRHKDAKAVVIPIFLRYCNLDKYPNITSLQGYPGIKTFIFDNYDKKDRYYSEIQAKLNGVADKIITERNIQASRDNKNGSENSDKANDIDALRNSNTIFLSTPSSPAGIQMRTRFIYNVDGKRNHEGWKYQVLPSIEDSKVISGLLPAEQSAKILEVIKSSLYFIHIVGSPDDLASELFKTQYNLAKTITGDSEFNRNILWLADQTIINTIDALPDDLKSALKQMPTIITPDNDAIFKLIDDFDISKQKKIKELVTAFSPVKKIFMFYDMQKDNDSDLRIQLRKKIQEDKAFVIRDLADQTVTEQTKALRDCDAAVIFYGNASDTVWYKVQERIVVGADNLRKETRAVFIDRTEIPDIERIIDRDISINEVEVIKGQGELVDRVEAFRKRLK